MCRTIENYQVDRCFAINCPLDQAIVRSMQLDGANHAVEMLNAKVAELEAKHEQVMADWAKSDSQKALHVGNLESKLEAVEEFLKDTLEGWAGSADEFSEYYGDLAEIVGFEMTREVQVTVTMSQVLTVKVPLGIELNENDFWTYKGEILECNYTVENEEDISIEDVTTY